MKNTRNGAGGIGKNASNGDKVKKHKYKFINNENEERSRNK